MSGTDRLEVTMFGQFTFSKNDKMLFGLSNKLTQNEKLIAVLICFGKEGVPTSFFRDEILCDQNVNDITHSLQSIIYNTKKRLTKDLELQDVPFYYEKQKYYWNVDLDMKVDVLEFEECLRKASAANSPPERYEQYLKACYLYKGDFLENFYGSIWVIGMANKYREMFADAISEAVFYMRQNSLYKEMEKLGRYASEVDPLSDWETVTMEALVKQGDYEKARAFYEQTCDYYLNEQGLRPSEKLSAFLQELGNQFEHHTVLLDEVYDALSKTNSKAMGGYVCTYPVFEGIYHVLGRLTARLGMSVYLMLCTVVDGKGNPMKEGPTLTEISEQLFEAIRLSVRQSDVINKYGKGQYLILLTNVSRENCGIIQKRINNRFRMGRRRTEVLYYLKSVIYTPEEAQQEKLLRREDDSQ